jgi:hypothetical protein
MDKNMISVVEYGILLISHREEQTIACEAFSRAEFHRESCPVLRQHAW